jgi:hypothetical protein
LSRYFYPPKAKLLAEPPSTRDTILLTHLLLRIPLNTKLNINLKKTEENWERKRLIVKSISIVCFVEFWVGADMVELMKLPLASH